MSTPALLALSPLDGRYEGMLEPLRTHMSEYALMRARLHVEVEYIIALCEEQFGTLQPMYKSSKYPAQKIVTDFTLEQAEIVKQIERGGHPRFAATNHDVAAIVLYLTDQFEISENSYLKRLSSIVHLFLTSMDVDTLAYALMVRGALEEAVVPELIALQQGLTSMAHEYAGLPMLARTHGQPATPTTLGKEFAVFANRLAGQINQLSSFSLQVKFSGASGNYNAHVATAPEIDWPAFAQKFIEQFNAGKHVIRLTQNPLTTQIEPHDTYAELFGILMRINTILIGFCQDMWRYISDDWLVQKPVAGEVGSSTMPHKVNPIDLENAEGNLGMANAMMEFFCRKLPVSRLQRDLSDSTVMRNFGSAFGHCLIGYKSISRGLRKVSANEVEIREALHNHPEVIAEAYQTVLRTSGDPEAYEKLRVFTRGEHRTLEELQEFMRSLGFGDDVLSIEPETYIGLAAKLARSV